MSHAGSSDIFDSSSRPLSHRPKAFDLGISEHSKPCLPSFHNDNP